MIELYYLYTTMKKSELKQLIKEVLSEIQHKPNDMRFDCNARVECWIQAVDISSHDGYDVLVKNTQLTLAAKIIKLKELALDIAREKISNIGSVDFKYHTDSGMEVTADITLGDVNIDRIDWEALANPQE